VAVGSETFPDHLTSRLAWGASASGLVSLSSLASIFLEQTYNASKQTKHNQEKKGEGWEGGTGRQGVSFFLLGGQGNKPCGRKLVAGRWEGNWDFSCETHLLRYAIFIFLPADTLFQFVTLLVMLICCIVWFDCLCYT
jgi:hypothetical protein